MSGMRDRAPFKVTSYILLLVLVGAIVACAVALVEDVMAQAGTFYVERVIDGDTILVEHVGTVRLLGINTPELAGNQRGNQPCAVAAAAFTRRMLEHNYIDLGVGPDAGRDRYGRLLAYVYFQGPFNERLVRHGLARVETRWAFSEMGAYLRAQRAAQRGQLGLWSPTPCP